MTKRKKNLSKGRHIWVVFLGVAILGLVVTVLLRRNNVALFNPKGTIARQQLRLVIISVLLLLEIAVPAYTLFYFTAWKYRESNEKATYSPHAKTNKSLVFFIWAVPSTTMLLLASVMWPAAHNLAPQKLISSGVKPLTIQVVAMRWKWLFIYPEQNIASVNFVQVPVGTPVQFNLTADDTPMSSFWIPQLGGQLYAMTGHVNLLNLMADTPGDFAGRTAEINGAGFAGMTFTARASSMNDFNTWVQGVKQSPTALDSGEYAKLLNPSEYNKAAFYSKAGPAIYDTMLAKYIGSHGQHTGVQ